MKPWIIRLLRLIVLIASFAFGVLTSRVVLVPDPCPGYPPTATVIASTVQSPLSLGFVSGISLGAWPPSGYGSPDACIDGDMGVGMPVAAFKSIRMSAAWAWAVGRGMGFVLSFWLLLWAASWLWRAVRSLSEKTSS